MPVGRRARSPRRCAPAPRSSTRCARSSPMPGYNTNVGDEGGFAPNLASADAALGFVMQAIEAAGYQPGDDVVLALDPAASEFYRDGDYALMGEGKTLDAAGMVGYLRAIWSTRYPIVSIEDGMAEDDWDGWVQLTRELGRQDPARRRRYLRHQPRAARAGHRARRRQRAAGQGQPDRHPVGDARSGRDRAARRLWHGDVAPLGRDRGHDDRRSRGRRPIAARSRPARCRARTGSPNTTS